MKKCFMSMLMAVCMVVALSGMCFATSPASTGIQEPEVPVEDFGEEGIMPLASWCPIDNLPITSGGLWWKQDSGYSTYRVWVQNDTNEEMTVTITYDGMPAGKFQQNNCYHRQRLGRCYASHRFPNKLRQCCRNLQRPNFYDRP